MKIIRSIILFITLHFSAASFAQLTDNEIETKEFLTQFFETTFGNYGIAYKVAEPLEPPCGINQSKFISEEEVAFANSELEKKLQKWDLSALPNLKSFTGDPITLNFSYPIFLRNRKYCVFYYGVYEGRLVSHNLSLYEKQDKIWKKIEEVCELNN